MKDEILIPGNVIPADLKNGSYYWLTRRGEIILHDGQVARLITEKEMWAIQLYLGSDWPWGKI